MTSVVFWDEDTQYDFMSPEGKLYVPQAETIVPNLQRLTDLARAHGVQIIDIMCDHVETDAEISSHPDFTTTFPPHCMRGTPGQQLIDATAPRQPLVFDSRAYTRAEVERRLRAHRGEILIKKQTLDPFSNPATALVLDLLAPETVIVYGVAIDFCVDQAVRGLRRRGPRVCVVRDAIKEITAEGARRCVEEWRRRGVELVTTDDVVAQRVVKLEAS
jgi:nicotinamidase/pyrazinamidase